MEQTQNSFSSGLQMDTHPMQQGQDTLTDALNATFVTMNGNEIVLQNDMGNARIQNAYLPQGYVPVGMKEYGGVIYVASYNPITDKGQIGSFPSPQRRFGSGIRNTDEGILDLNLFFENDKIIKRDILTPVDSKNLLRAGDKFVLYSSNLRDIKTYISNWENIQEYKVKSPKNNYITLQAGILNSKNEFVDITKTLYRFDNSGNLINFKDSDSELYKFNKGYFIKDSFDDTNIAEQLSIATSELEKCRTLDKYNLNTYAYKLVGPLYLKATLNVPTDFDYSIYGYRDENGICYLQLEYNLIYNCPDGGIYHQNQNSEYYSYGDNCPALNLGCKFIYYDENSNECDLLPERFQSGLSSYNDSTNVYKVSQFIKYRFQPEDIGQDSSLVINLDNSHYEALHFDERFPFTLQKDIPTRIKSPDQDYINFIFTRDGVQYEHLIDWEENTATIAQDYVNSFDLNIISKNEFVITKLDDFPYNLYFGTIGQSSGKININYRKQQIPNILYYKLIPTIKIPTGNDKLINLPTTGVYEITDLTQTGTLDLSKLGSGEMSLTGWRFYNDLENKVTSISYSFDAYPKRNHKFENLKFDFWKVIGDVDNDPNLFSLDINDGLGLEECKDLYLINAVYVGTFVPDSSIEYNGRRDDVIDWESLGTSENYRNNLCDIIYQTPDSNGESVSVYASERGLSQKQMYQVIISWDDVTYDTNGIQVGIEHNYEYRWLLTTELFNNNYFANNKFIKDFCNPSNSQEQQYYDENVTLIPNLDYTVESTTTSWEEEMGSKIKQVSNPNTEQTMLWGYDTIYNTSSNFPVTLNWNQELYPDYITIVEPTITNYGKNFFIQQQDYVIQNKGYDGSYDENFTPYLLKMNRDIPFEFNGNFYININYDFTLMDRIFAKSKKIEGVFADIKYENIKEMNPEEQSENLDIPRYLGISLGFRNTSGHGSRLLIHSIWINNSDNDFNRTAANYSSDRTDPPAVYTTCTDWYKRVGSVFGQKNNAGLLYCNHQGNYQELYRISKKDDLDITEYSKNCWKVIENEFNSKYPENSKIFQFCGECTTNASGDSCIKPYKTRYWMRAKYGIGEYGWALTNSFINDDIFCASEVYDNVIQDSNFITMNSQKYSYNDLYKVDTSYNLYFKLKGGINNAD